MPPRKGPVAGRPRTKPRTDAQLERQNDVFEDSVIRSLTIRQLAAKHRVAINTIQADLRAESALRSEELAARREQERARSITFYGHVINKAFEKSDRYDAITEHMLELLKNPPGDNDVEYDDEGRPKPRPKNAGASFRFTDSTLADAIKARERMDKLIGLDAPTKTDAGIEALVDALSQFPAERPPRKMPPPRA